MEFVETEQKELLGQNEGYHVHKQTVSHSRLGTECTKMYYKVYQFSQSTFYFYRVSLCASTKSELFHPWSFTMASFCLHSWKEMHKHIFDAILMNNNSCIISKKRPFSLRCLQKICLFVFNTFCVYTKDSDNVINMQIALWRHRGAFERVLPTHTAAPIL